MALWEALGRALSETANSYYQKINTNLMVREGRVCVCLCPVFMQNKTQHTDGEM